MGLEDGKWTCSTWARNTKWTYIVDRHRVRWQVVGLIRRNGLAIMRLSSALHIWKQVHLQSRRKATLFAATWVGERGLGHGVVLRVEVENDLIASGSELQNNARRSERSSRPTHLVGNLRWPPAGRAAVQLDRLEPRAQHRERKGEAPGPEREKQTSLAIKIR